MQRTLAVLSSYLPTWPQVEVLPLERPLEGGGFSLDRLEKN